MAFEKGNTHGKGRIKGSKNKSTIEIRNFYNQFISDQQEQLYRDWKKLEPSQRIRYLIDLTRFVIPTLRAVSNEIDELSDEQFNRLYEKLKNEYKL